MKIPHMFAQKERGQVIVLLAIMTVTILAFIFLLFDGGAMMISRRQAQAAADAGALAGVRELCEKNYGAIISTAKTYAASNNAIDSLTEVAYSDNQVSVTASVQNNAILFTDPGFTTADATAACLIPDAYFLPISFYCPNPDSSTDCGVDMYDLGGNPWNGDQPPSTLYVFPDHIMPDKDVSLTRCDLAMDCNIDRNGDGSDDTKVLDLRDYVPALCSSGVVPCLKAIFNHSIPPPTIDLTLTAGWVPIQENADLTAFNITIDSELPNLFLVPFYDACSPSGNNCRDAKSVHIAGVSGFIVWCESKKIGLQKPSDCAGKTGWMNENPLLDGARTIEGFFVKGVDYDSTGAGMEAPNMGIYYISLID
jgi:hypothetical protein